MITCVGPRVTPVFTGYERDTKGYQQNPNPTNTAIEKDRFELNQTNPADNKITKTEKQKREELVTEYIEKHHTEIKQRCCESDNTNPHKAKADVTTPLGVLVQNCGDDLDKISKEYGTTGLAMYINLAEMEPEKTRSVIERIKPDELTSYFVQPQYKNIDWMGPDELISYALLYPQDKKKDPNFNPLVYKYGNNLMNFLNPDVSCTNTISNRSKSSDQRKRILKVQDYLKTRTPRKVEDRTKSEFISEDARTPLKTLIAKCGDDVNKIDKEFGLKGLEAYMFDEKPEITKHSVCTQISYFLLNNCQNRKFVPIHKIYDNFGDYGMNVYDKEYSFFMNKDILGLGVTIPSYNFMLTQAVLGDAYIDKK